MALLPEGTCSGGSLYLMFRLSIERKPPALPVDSVVAGPSTGRAGGFYRSLFVSQSEHQ
jgi:hypothetical protein